VCKAAGVHEEDTSAAQGDTQPSARGPPTGALIVVVVKRFA
jgi:hypothetical protein